MTALYEAVVTHERRAPIRNRFRYRAFYWLVDYDRPPQLPRGLRWLSRWDPSDHVDVRAVLAEHGLQADRIVMLANARMLGYVFNPITVHWCYRDGDPDPTVVAEVHNTYGGRHAYVLPLDDAGCATIDKQLYVSPFYPVDGRYEIRVSEPGDRVHVAVTLRRDEDEPFVATLLGRRRPARLRTVAAAMLRHPWSPLRTSMLIRWQGIRLWLRGLEVHPR